MTCAKQIKLSFFITDILRCTLYLIFNKNNAYILITLLQFFFNNKIVFILQFFKVTWLQKTFSSKSGQQTKTSFSHFTRKLV